MTLIEQIRWFQAVVKEPAASIKEEKIRTGKNAVGCFLAFCPEEIVYAANLLPVELWGKTPVLSEAKKYFPSFFCAPIQQNLELAMHHAFDKIICAVIVPVFCDALKSAGQNWKIAVPDIPMIPFVYPAKRNTKSAMRFLKEEYQQVKEKLETLTGKSIQEEEMKKAIAVYNAYRQEARRFCLLAKDHLDIITPLVRHDVLMAACYVDKARYTEMLKTLNEELKKLPTYNFKGKKVIVAGVEFAERELLRELEEQNMAVTSDNLIQESVNIAADVPDEEEDSLLCIAKRWQNQKYTSVVSDLENRREDYLVRLAKREDAAVLFILTSFCDPEEYDYPLIRKRLEEEGIPQIMIEINGTDSLEQAVTRIQAFAERLSE